jgi:ureidoacrylate peracid hydrolase
MNTQVADTAATGAPTDELAQWIAPGRTALLIIDIQVDFAAPDGALGLMGVDMSVVAPAIKQSERLADLARKAGVPVVFIGLQTQDTLDSPSWLERQRRRGGNPSEESALCRAGTPGADFYGPQPKPGELVIGKIRYSGFYGTNLNSGLHALGVDTLVVCGLTTECCIDCTVRDAFHLDYHVFVATDASAAYEVDIHESTLKSLEMNCAILVTTDQVDAAWTKAPVHG